MSGASSAAEYLAVQRECLAVARADEALAIARAADSDSRRRCDCFQIVYWLTPPDERVDRFRELFDGSAEEEREFLKALLFRAVTEHTVRSTNLDRVDRYLGHVQEEFAKSLFAS